MRIIKQRRKNSDDKAVFLIMARLPDEFISQLKSANDIVEMFRTYADLKKRGRTYVCCCPFHSEKTPSCTVYPESASFYCFGCGVGGDVIKFVMLTDNISYMEAVRTLAQRCGMTIPSQSPEEKKKTQFRDRCLEINRETANFYYLNLLKGSDKTGLQYLKYYHIQPETIKKYAIGYASDDWQALHYHLRQKGYSDEELLTAGLCRPNQHDKLYDKFRHRILFPVVDFRGNVTAFGGKAVEQEKPPFLITEDTPVSSRNRTIFSLQLARNSNHAKSIILAEDYFCTAAVYQAGFENVISVPEEFTALHAQAVIQYAKEIILISSHAAKYGNIQKIRNLCSHAGLAVKVVSLQDAQDSAGFIRKYGNEEFRNLLAQAGDAVQTALQNSWKGLDKKRDRYTMIQKSAKILSGIRNPLEQEIYLNQTAEDLNLTREQLQSEIDRLNHKKPVISEKKSRPLDKSELFSINQPNLKQRRAEEQILVYLSRFPEEIPNIQEKLSPEYFVTAIHCQLYQLLCESGSLPSETPPELSALLKKYQGIEFTAESTEACIKVLKSPRKRGIL